MPLNNLQVLPGYQLGVNEPLTNAILNAIAKPSVTATLTDPITAISYWRNGNFYSGFWATPSGVSCPVSTETFNASFWSVNCSGAAVTYKQSTTTPDKASLYSLEIDGNTGTTDVWLSQQLSPDFSAVLRGFVTISGWQLNTTAATVTPVLEVWSCNTLSSYSAITQRSSTSMQSCPVGIWTYTSITVSIDVTNATNGLLIRIKLPNPALSGTAYKWNFDRLQLQQGSVATPFLDDINLFATLPTIVNANLGTACVSYANLDSTITSGLLPSGAVQEFAGIAVPTGWLYCDGSAVSRSTYSTLFSAITVSTTGNTTNTSSTISVTSATNLKVGYFVSGAGIAAAATVTAIAGTSLTLSVPCTGNNTGTALIFAPHGIGDGSTTFNVPDFRGKVAVCAGTGTGLTARTLGQIGGEEAHVLVTGELAAHNHAINDSGHTHSVGDPTHTHGFSDPGHSHGVSDPTHSHTYTNPAGTNLGSIGSGILVENGSLAYTGASSTGISIQARGTGCSNLYAYTGISIYPVVTGISVYNTGSSTAHNTMQPFLVVHKIIKT